MRNALFFALLILSCCNTTVDKSHKSTNSFEGKVVAIKDGDTFKVLENGAEKTVRLEHIDCPEKGQPFGNNAKQLASDLCFNKIARVVSNGKTDRYNRIIGEIYVGNICVNKELVKNGLAWHFVRYSKSNEYAALEQEARKNNVGLWKDQNAIAPWEWRSNRKKLKR